MNIIFKISLRNLVRQKRRNLLLGSGIMIGVCLLVMANALSAGITDMIFNGMVATFSGHIFVTMSEKDKYQYSIIRDQDRMKDLILDTLEDVWTVGEYLSAGGRALGNGKASYLSVIGIQAIGQLVGRQGLTAQVGKHVQLGRRPDHTHGTESGRHLEDLFSVRSSLFHGCYRVGYCGREDGSLAPISLDQRAFGKWGRRASAAFFS